MAKGKFEPMKAPTDPLQTPAEIAKLRWPMFLSPKIDGIRMTHWGNMVSRSNTPFPSAFVHDTFKLPDLLGVDGEASAGEPNSPLVFSDTFSAMMTHGCQTPVIWNVFDYCHPAHWTKPYDQRLDMLRELVHSLPLMYIRVVEQILVHSWEEAKEIETGFVVNGYEGGMLHGAYLPYKFGRSTLNQNYLIKMKEFETREARIEGFYELEHNDNEATVSNTGATKRSSHKSGMRLAGTLGGFIVRDLSGGPQFRLGSGLGLDASLRAHIWANRPAYMAKIVSYKKLKVGEKDKPRNATYRGFRDPIDM